MSNEIRFTITNDVHNAMRVDAFLRKQIFNRIAADIILDVIENGWPNAGVVARYAVTAGSRVAVAKFDDAEFRCVENFAEKWGLSLNLLARIAVSARYDNVALPGSLNELALAPAPAGVSQ